MGFCVLHTFELACDCLNTRLLDAGFIHERAIKSADLALKARGYHIAFRGERFHEKVQALRDDIRHH